MGANHSRRNAVCAVLTVIVLIVFCIMAYSYKSRTSEERSRLEAVVSEAKPYEDELTQLKRDLSSAAEKLSETSDTATAQFVVGYTVLSEDDIAYAEEQASKYGFSPVLILDCTYDLTELEPVALAAGETGNEIMLTASAFSEGINETVKSLIAYMVENGIEYSDIFLLRSDYSSGTAVDMLISDGFIGYTVYNTTPSSGLTDEGYVTFDYSYLTTDSSSYTRFSSSYSNMASMIIAIDVNSVRTGTLTEGFLTTLLSTVSSYTENDDCEFSSIAEVSEYLLSGDGTKSAETAEYEAYVAECEERIAELEEIIAEIYSKLD